MDSSLGINMFSSSSSSSFPAEKCDVYLNFRSEDVGNTFVSHLYAALLRKNINTFMDLDHLDKTEEISRGIMKAIDGSKVSVIIFSENYASSPKCLDELVHILECKERLGQLVLPVFYHVDPSHVRNSFHELPKVDKWRRALEAASDLKGYTSEIYK